MSRPHRQPSLRGRRLRMEYCESRCVLSATTGAVTVDAADSDAAMVYLQTPGLSGWTPIDGDSQLTIIGSATGSEFLLKSADSLSLASAEAGSLGAVLVRPGLTISVLGFRDVATDGQRFSDLLGRTEWAVAADSNNAEILRTYLHQVTVDAAFSLDATLSSAENGSNDLLTDGFTREDVITNSNQGTVNWPDSNGSISGAVTGSSSGNGTGDYFDAADDGVSRPVERDAAEVTLTDDVDGDSTTLAGQDLSPAERPTLRPELVETGGAVSPPIAEPMARAQTAIGGLRRVAAAPAPPAGAGDPNAGLIDLAELLLSPTAETTPATFVAAAPSDAARDAALALESWVRTLPTPAEAPAVASGDTSLEGSSFGVKALPLPAPGSATPAHSSRDDLSSVGTPSNAAVVDGGASSERLEGRGYRYFLASLTTLLGGAVLATARRGRPAAESECVETPRRESPRDR
ncbi:hypothetical protein Pla108_27930 [Botrimarina colliarenosi]|uniref:Uncharacterized protein n=1 Tax=Botrimarina colliarenosi TaxID=2528001 RepID=A0A5C6AC73_9BACT|nr:hypothetical protein [Botrimarina colliarenosi]TWT97016.1 hypothetical protein Pla108_27930 [Botrimarina colliarenosi]